MDVKGGVVDIVWRCSRVVVVAVKVGVLEWWWWMLKVV